MNRPATITKAERKRLRELAGEAWEAELRAALDDLYEDFGVWAEKGMSSFELSDKIHKFHNGIARELYGRYTGLGPEFTVSRAIALGLLSENGIDDSLRAKLGPRIESLRGEFDE